MNDNHRPVLRIVCSCATKVGIERALGDKGFEVFCGPPEHANRDGGDVHILLGSLVTDSEQRVLQCIADSPSVASVAEKLDVSPETVTRHLMHIRKKLGVATTVQAVGWALRHGMID